MQMVRECDVSTSGAQECFETLEEGNVRETGTLPVFISTMGFDVTSLPYPV